MRAEKASRVIGIAAQPSIGEIDGTPGRQKYDEQRQELTV